MPGKWTFKRFLALALVLMTTVIFHSSELRAGVLTNIRYQCSSLLKGERLSVDVWRKSHRRPKIITNRLLLRTMDLKQDAKILLQEQDVLQQTLKESSAPKKYEKISDAFLPVSTVSDKSGFRISVQYLLFEKASSKVVGFLRVTWIPAEQLISFGGGILPQFRRKGFAREARLGVIDFYSKLGVTKFETMILPSNQPSIQLSKSLGFQRLGTITIPHAGKQVQVVVFELNLLSQ